MGLGGFAMAAVNAAWQSALLVLLAGLLLRFTRPTAAGHAAVWTAVLFASVVLLPLDLAFERTAHVAIATAANHTFAASAKPAPGPISIAALSAPAQSAGMPHAMRLRSSLRILHRGRRSRSSGCGRSFHCGYCSAWRSP